MKVLKEIGRNVLCVLFSCIIILLLVRVAPSYLRVTVATVFNDFLEYVQAEG